MVRSGNGLRVVVRLAAVLALLLSLGVAGAAEAQEVGLAIGAVPEIVQIDDLQGNAVSFSEFVGKKPVLVQFWATWCPVCEALDPKLRAARQRHGDALEIVIVAVGVNQTVRSINRHVERHPMPGRVLFDNRGRATRAFKAPTTSYVVALDANGRVVYTGVGADQDIAAAAAKAVGR